jgi:tripartite-type tricarboxylate transporter receptor subunit TctC
MRLANRFMTLFFIFVTFQIHLPLSAQPVTKNTYPNRPITIIVPMGAGGASDVLVRSMANTFSQELGQAIIIENKAGANGLIGEEQFSKTSPDGYTLMFGSSSSTTNLWLHQLGYDPRQVFVPISRVGAVPMALIVNTKHKVTNLKDFIALAKKANPPLDFASWGEGSISHISGELFKNEAGLELHHIPYKTSPQALNDTLSGQVDMAFVSLAAAQQQIKGGRINLLAITSKERSPSAPQIPTMFESGYPNVVIESWFGLFAPQGTSPDILKVINLALSKTLGNAEVRKTIESQGYRLINDSSDEFKKFYINEINLNGKILKNMKSQ